MDRFHLLLAPETPSSGEPARRAGSVTLRQNEDGPDSAALMDPAN